MPNKPTCRTPPSFRQGHSFSLVFQGLSDATGSPRRRLAFYVTWQIFGASGPDQSSVGPLTLLGNEPTRLDLIGVLRICSAQSAYRKRYRGDLNLRNVADFLLFSQDFPRSLRFAIRRIDSNLHDISGVPAGNFSNEAERLTGSVLAQLNFSGIDAMLGPGFTDPLMICRKN